MNRTVLITSIFSVFFLSEAFAGQAPVTPSYFLPKKERVLPDGAPLGPGFCDHVIPAGTTISVDAFEEAMGTFSDTREPLGEMHVCFEPQVTLQGFGLDVPQSHMHFVALDAMSPPTMLSMDLVPVSKDGIRVQFRDWVSIDGFKIILATATSGPAGSDYACQGLGAFVGSHMFLRNISISMDCNSVRGLRLIWATADMVDGISIAGTAFVEGPPPPPTSQWGNAVGMEIHQYPADEFGALVPAIRNFSIGLKGNGRLLRGIYIDGRYTQNTPAVGRIEAGSISIVSRGQTHFSRGIDLNRGARVDVMTNLEVSVIASYPGYSGSGVVSALYIGGQVNSGPSALFCGINELSHSNFSASVGNAPARPIVVEQGGFVNEVEDVVPAQPW